MPASRAAADEPQPLPMGISFLMRSDNGITSATPALEDLAVGGENKVILQGLADFRITSGSTNRKLGGRPGIDRDVEVHRQSSGIESWTQIRRGRREGQMQRGWTRIFFFLGIRFGIRVRGIGFLRPFQGLDYGVQSGIEDDGRMAQRLQ